MLNTSASMTTFSLPANTVTITLAPVLCGFDSYYSLFVHENLCQCSFKINVFTAKLHPLQIDKVSWSRGGETAGEGRQQCRATGEGGSCYRAAAGGGSRRRLIRKYEPTSAVALATPAARRMKIKQKKFFLCRVFFFKKKCFPVIESGVGLWVVGIITLHAVSQGRRQHCVVWIRMMVIKSGMK